MDKSTEPPLIINLDHQLLKTNLADECFWAALSKYPSQILEACVKTRVNKQHRETVLFQHIPLNDNLLPLNETIIHQIDSAKNCGRSIIVNATFQHPVHAKLAARLGILKEQFAITPSPVSKRQDSPNWQISQLLKALRPHQWVKNFLLFLPMITAHSFNLSTLLTCLIAFISFSAAASSIYVINDLLDLEADRQHNKKRRRPMASGQLPIFVAARSSALLCGVALFSAAALNAAFFAIIILYMLLSLTYSLKLKRIRWIDISALALLYTIRVIAGGLACDIELTIYLLAFIFPVFFCLSCVKRLTELRLTTSERQLPGRGYARQDRAAILNLASIAVLVALLVFLMYSFTNHAIDLYNSRWLIWLAEVPLAWWLIRMVRLGWYGKQDYDPLVFAMTDLRGIGLILMTVSIMFYAAGLLQSGYGQFFSIF